MPLSDDEHHTTQNGSRANILVLMSDQHNPYITGCYGNELVRTPNIDSLAEDGMRFDNAYCPSPVCSPSRKSFLTAQYPVNTQVWHNRQILCSGIPTWAHVVGRTGYETALIGRMHLKGADLRHGFEKRPLGARGARFPGTKGTGFTGKLQGTSGQSRRSVENAGRGRTRYQWYDDQVAEETIRYLESHADSEKPFAAVAGFVLPHCPFVAPQELFDYYYDRVSIPDQPTDQPETIKRFRQTRGILDPLPAERIRVARAAYFALVEYLDSLIGEILETLERVGLADDTVVLYTSDHGEMAGEHGCWWKSTYYEGSAGVPLLARLPGTIPSGTTTGAIANLVDLGPTFADVAGGTFDTPIDGRSLWSTLQGDHPDDWNDETFSELVDRRESIGPSRMIRQGRFKLWDFPLQPDLEPALFDLETDPNERNDLATDSNYADVRDRLLDRLYENWDPNTVAEISERRTAEYNFLEEWGETVQPEHPDDVSVSPPNFEEDVELL